MKNYLKVVGYKRQVKICLATYHPLTMFQAKKKNRERLIAVRDGAPTAVEALGRMLTDEQLIDDGTVPGRVWAILQATEHRFVPGLHTGLVIGLTGFRPEYQDPWKSSADQVGHFLTAVRLAFNNRFLANPIFPLLLGSLGDKDVPLRLMIGHEKWADPSEIDQLNLRIILNVLNCFRKQYQSASDQDVANFRAGRLEAIPIGNGLGNSMADLRLSYQGWLFGQQVRQFANKTQAANWVRDTLGGAENQEPNQ